jgi:hypothetical protein
LANPSPPKNKHNKAVDVVSKIVVIDGTIAAAVEVETDAEDLVAEAVVIAVEAAEEIFVVAEVAVEIVTTGVAEVIVEAADEMTDAAVAETMIVNVSRVRLFCVMSKCMSDLRKMPSRHFQSTSKAPFGHSRWSMWQKWFWGLVNVTK